MADAVDAQRIPMTSEWELLLSACCRAARDAEIARFLGEAEQLTMAARVFVSDEARQRFEEQQRRDRVEFWNKLRAQIAPGERPRVERFLRTAGIYSGSLEPLKHLEIGCELPASAAVVFGEARAGLLESGVR